jgi:hypothetical protein
LLGFVPEFTEVPEFMGVPEFTAEETSNNYFISISQDNMSGKPEGHGIKKF